MRVLLIGGTGFIGPSVVARLCELGHEVTVYHRGETRMALPAAAQELPGDRSQLGERARELRRRAEVVVDMRPMSEEDARTVVSAFRGNARRLIAVSSQDVYLAYGRMKGTEPGPIEVVPLTEDSALRSVLFPYRDEP